MKFCLPHSQVYRFRVNANRKVRLEKVFCDAQKPGDAIAVTVKGKARRWVADEFREYDSFRKWPESKALPRVGN